jgi:hypothetical protein
VRELATTAGFDTVADYLRYLLAKDLEHQAKGLEDQAKRQ